jgi:hypothetical protein
MPEEVRIILDIDDSASIPLESAPEGVFDLSYEMPRSEKFWGMIPAYSGELRFGKDGKDYIDNIIDTEGKESIITIDYQVRDTQTTIFSTLVEGILNLLDSVRSKNKTSTGFEGTSFEVKLNKRSNIEVPYYRLTSLNGTVLPGFVTPYVNLLCQGVLADIITRSIYPHELIESILQQILDVDYPCLYSPILGRTDIVNPMTLENYPDNGDLSKKMITKATYLRGWNETNDNLYISLDKAFAIFDCIIPLGLGFTKDSQDRDIVFIDHRESVFQSRIGLQLDDDKISNLEKFTAQEMRWSEAELGFPEALKNVVYGLSEYVGKSSYSNTSISSDSKLDLVNPARGDGVGINDIIDNFQIDSASTDETSEYDKEIFIIDSMDEIGVGYIMKNLKTENYTSWEGIENDPGLHYNFDLTPARILEKYYGKWLNISLQDLTGYLKHNKAETLSRLRTLRIDDTSSIYECQDLLLSVLETPIMTGDIYSLNYPLTTDNIRDIKDDYYAQCSFWDYSQKKTIGGWFRNISAKLPKGIARIEIYEAVTLATLLGLELNEDGGYALAEDGTFVELETLT